MGQITFSADWFKKQPKYVLIGGGIVVVGVLLLIIGLLMLIF